MPATNPQDLYDESACFACIAGGAQLLMIAILDRISSALSIAAIELPLAIGSPSAMVVYGDSISCGWSGTEFAVYSQVDKLSDDNGWAITNHALGGHVLAWSADAGGANLFSETAADGTVYWLGHGFGENAFLTSDTKINTMFKSELLACSAWLAIDDGRKVKGNGTVPSGIGMVKSGTWATTPFYSFGCASIVNGSTITITGMSGSKFIFCFTGFDPANLTNPGTFTIHVDGVLHGTYNCQWPESFDIPLAVPSSWQKIPMGILIETAPGAHTFVITNTSASGAANIVEFDWCAELSSASAVEDGCLMIAGVTLAAPDEQENPDNRYEGQYASRIARMNAVQSEVSATLRNSGLKVIYVDSYSAITDTSVDILPDAIHPSETGYMKIAAKAQSKFTTP